MKPISTLMKPLRSVDLQTMAESPAAIERSDVCAVPAAARDRRGDGLRSCSPTPFLEKFGGDSIAEINAQLRARARARAGAIPPRRA